MPWYFVRVEVLGRYGLVASNDNVNKYGDSVSRAPLWFISLNQNL